MGTIEANRRSNLLNINEYRLNKVIGQGNSIREFEDRYEYCIMDGYDKKYDKFTCHSIDLGDIFVEIVTVEGDHKLASIGFPKDIFNYIQDIPDYLDFYSIKLLKNGRNTIYKACDYWSGVKFRGTAIVVYEKGLGTFNIDLDELPEVTELFDKKKYRVNRSSLRVKTNITSKPNIFLNSLELDFVPEIEIDLNKDLIIANGHVILAGYIGDYEGHVGFFKNKDDELPISWIHDSEATVFIDFYNPGEGRVIVIEYSYTMDFKDFN